MPDEPDQLAATSRASVQIDAPRDAVFDVLTDPRTYPLWLGGAQAVRSVDGSWPRPGARFHHRIGIGPWHVEDVTELVELERPSTLLLRASLGPFGSALVRFDLTGSDPTDVSLTEAPAAGPLRFIGLTIGRLTVKATFWGRNGLALHRLKALTEYLASLPAHERGTAP